MSYNLFIGGLMKSGTSLLRTLVQQNGRYLGGPETHWFKPSFVYHPDDKLQNHVKILFNYFDLQNDIESKALDLTCGVSNKILLQELFNFLCDKQGKQNWVEKTPDNMYHIDYILNNFEDSRFILVHRDPFDVYASWKTNNKGSIEVFSEALKNYLVNHDKCLANHKCSIVNYEDLINNTQKTMNDVMTFLECETFDITSFKGDHDFKTRIEKATGKKSPTAESLAKPIFNSSIGKWKDVLDENEERRIWNVLNNVS